MSHVHRVIVVAYATVDGVVEDPDGSWGAPFGGWGSRAGPEAFAGDRFEIGPLLGAGALLFGRRTWQLFAQRWPRRTGDFAEVMNRARKYVASRTLRSVEGWSNSVLLEGALVPAVEQLLEERDVIVAGSTALVHQLASARMVDEYRFILVPAVAGAGQRLFAEGEQAGLELVSVDVTRPTVSLRYRVSRSPASS